MEYELFKIYIVYVRL